MKNVNNKGIKGYRDEFIATIEQPSDIEFEKFPKEGHEELLKESMDINTEFGKLDDTTLGSDANPEIEHFSETSKHCKSHEVPESAKEQGQQSSGNAELEQESDDPASDASDSEEE